MTHVSTFRSRRSAGAAVVGALFALLSFAACSSAVPKAPEPDSARERVGVYDGRAVAVAYANSDLFRSWLETLQQQHSEAEASGDQARATRLAAEAEAQQARFHGQAFQGDPIDDILARVQDRVAAIRHDAGVARLERVNGERSGDVSTVDVTDQLVALFALDARAREWIRQLRDQPLAK